METNSFVLPWGFTLSQGISLSDCIGFLSFIAALIGGIFAIYQWRKSQTLKRADYVNELTEKIRTDQDIAKTIYIFDYGEQWYSLNFHGNNKIERPIDRTLAFFSYICYLKKKRIITNNEFAFFRYDVERILMNNQTKDYFYNLYHFSQKMRTPFSFDALFEYGKRIKLYEKEFWDPNAWKKSEKYHHNLNF